MSALRFSDRAINWFQLYLSNRSFRVNVPSKYSCIAKIGCGVPQGSILEPCDLFLYADDSCLVCRHKDVKKIERNLNKDFSDFCD